MSNGSLFAETRRQLNRLGLRARKGLAQHFMVDEKVLRVIVNAADLTREDTVIEVGSGLGFLTRELARKAGRVIAVELDARLAANLEEALAPFSNVTIVNDDILNVNPEDLLRKLKPSAKSYKMVANLPYYITSPVLRHFLEASLKPELMVVTVQKEVAASIAAKPGQRSVLSISIQFYGKPRIIGKVPARAFYPAPKVESAVLRIDVFPEPVMPVTDVAGFFKVVRGGFAAPRKQILNSLAQGLGITREEAITMLEKAGIDPQRRAETLTIEEWAQLWQAYRGE